MGLLICGFLKILNVLYLTCDCHSSGGWGGGGINYTFKHKMILVIKKKICNF